MLYPSIYKYKIHLFLRVLSLNFCLFVFGGGGKEWCWCIRVVDWFGHFTASLFSQRTFFAYTLATFYQHICAPRGRNACVSWELAHRTCYLNRTLISNQRVSLMWPLQTNGPPTPNLVTRTKPFSTEPVYCAALYSLQENSTNVDLLIYSNEKLWAVSSLSKR